MKQHGAWAFPDTDVWMAAEQAADGSYQADHLALALSFVTGWTLALDAGAHCGTWTKPLSARFKGVIAVEPAADAFEALVANMATFGCTNVDCRPVALGAAPGTVRLVLDAREQTRGNTGGRYVQPGGPIARETIDSWALPALDFLKADVEGSELPLLIGAVETLRRYQPIVLFEEKGFGVRYGVHRGEIAAFLTGLGYQPLAVISADQIWGPAPERAA